MLIRVHGAYRPVIDRVYPLDEVVEANRFVESERKTGNVVLSMPGWRGTQHQADAMSAARSAD